MPRKGHFWAIGTAETDVTGARSLARAAEEPQALLGCRLLRWRRPRGGGRLGRAGQLVGQGEDVLRHLLSRWLITNGTPRFTARTRARPSETIVCGIFRARLASTSEALMPPELSLRFAKIGRAHV